ncbi:MAG: M28 family metallopeptidase [Armatimonadetes bacterium]|nr:M28 family metallopeptidase [Armatimonadota bacterium]
MLATAALLMVGTLDLNSLVSQVDPRRMRATVEKLASWPNRNTNNSTLTEAAEWIAAEYRKIPGIEVEIMRYTVKKSARIAADKEVVQAIATLKGATDRRLIVGGHFDTINMVERSTESTYTNPSPGANDDASGTSLALELARLMASHKWNHTIHFVAFSGEEQGLLGSGALAARAKKEGWTIDGVFSNDMVGNSGNTVGKNTKQVRVFSDDTDHPLSRELARFVAWHARGEKFTPKLVLRKDRFGRGGDHTPFHNVGFPAIRFVEVYEEYTRQHTADDRPEFMDWGYLGNVAKLNLRALATLAQAGPPPTDVRIDRRQSHETRITWKSKPGVNYVVFWRDTRSAEWTHSRPVGAVSEATITEANKDDYIFGVAPENGVPVEAL